MTIHIHHHSDNDLKDFIFLIIKNQKRIMSDLTALQAAVAAETSIDASVEALLNRLAADLGEANAANDQPAIDAIVTTMKQNAAALSAAITANTPADPTPTPTPVPDPTQDPTPVSGS